MDDKFGSIEIGKACGLNLLNLDAKLQITADTRVQRIV
jgi:hypothetical protein